MAKFRKKPMVIEAHPWQPECLPAMPSDTEQRVLMDHGAVVYGRPPHNWWIDTLEGPLKVSAGDWIIRGVKGEFYPCKPDIFAETYEPLEAREGSEDTARLDWLESTRDWALPIQDPSGRWWVCSHEADQDDVGGDTLRAAIDAARGK